MQLHSLAPDGMTRHADILAPGHALAQLVGSSLYLDELNDQMRNECYFSALKAMVRPGDRILDIGTGSGLLSCLAVKALLAQGKVCREDWCDHAECSIASLSANQACAGQGVEKDAVTAIEAFPPMAALASVVLHANGMSDQVKVINKHSTDVTVADSHNAGISSLALPSHSAAL